MDIAQIPEDIRVFLLRMLTDANMVGIDDKETEDMLLDQYQKLTRFLIAKILQNLESKDAATFLELEKNGLTPEIIQAFLFDHVPNAQEVFAASLAQFHDFFVEAAHAVREKKK